MDKHESSRRCQGCRRIMPVGTEVWGYVKPITVLRLDGTLDRYEIVVWKCDDCTS